MAGEFSESPVNFHALLWPQVMAAENEEMFMWCGKDISFFIVFWMLFSLVNCAYGADIGQIKINGDGYVHVTENPNADSPGIGWIPEGDFVKILAGPFVGTLGRIPVTWHQIEYKEKKSFVLSHLLDFYIPSEEAGKKGVARIKINGNGYVNIRVSSNVDSSVIGCIPEGKIIKVLSAPVQGYVGDMSGYWYKVERQGNTGFIWGGLLEFYSLSSQEPEGISLAGSDDKIDEKKLAKKVIEMIKDGRDIFFEYKDGELTIETSYGSDPNGSTGRDGYMDRGGYTRSGSYSPNN
ncbi:SH3 domain-containing protein [Desulfobulbus sp. US4]|nr:SH3 domain-containing protein [Desulfobulbus sp. US4]